MADSQWFVFVLLYYKQQRIWYKATSSKQQTCQKEVVMFTCRSSGRSFVTTENAKLTWIALKYVWEFLLSYTKDPLGSIKCKVNFFRRFDVKLLTSRFVQILIHLNQPEWIGSTVGAKLPFTARKSLSILIRKDRCQQIFPT